MIHKNRGNRRWVDKRKRRNKYNLAKKICDSIKGVLGKYDKGHIFDLNDKYEPSYYEYYQGDGGLSHSDKKKVESCNDRIKDYESWFGDDMYNAMLADCEDYDEDCGDE